MTFDALLASGMRAIVRERNSNFYYCEKLMSDIICGDVGKLIAQYCYGGDCVIPINIVYILLGDRKFRTPDNLITYRCEFNSYGGYDAMCIVFNVGTVNERDYYLNSEEWMDFLLTGYNKSVYQTKAIPAMSQWVPNVEFDISSKDLNMVRREMLDAAARM